MSLDIREDIKFRRRELKQEILKQATDKEIARLDYDDLINPNNYQSDLEHGSLEGASPLSHSHFIQSVGQARCIRCDYKTDEGSFDEQDAALRKHLDEKHPGWQLEDSKPIIDEEKN
jgi:hypothetical protein